MPKSLLWSIKLLLTAAILSVIVWKVDLQSVRDTFSSLAPEAVFIAFAIVFIQAVCAAARLSMVVAAFARHLPFGDSLRITIESIFFGQTFVSFLGSDALRIWRVRKSGFSLEQTTTVITLDRLIGIIVNHVLLLASLPWLLITIQNTTVRLGLVVLAVAGIAGTGTVLLLGYLRGRIFVSGPIGARLRSSRAAGLLVEAATVGRHLLRPNSLIIKAAGVSVLCAACSGLAFFVLLLGWRVEPSVAFLAALLVPAVLEIAMLPISIAGWGVREGAAIVAFGTVGVSAPVALGSSVAFALLILTLGLAGGALWLFDRRAPRNLSVADLAPEPTAALDASTAKSG